MTRVDTKTTYRDHLYRYAPTSPLTHNAPRRCLISVGQPLSVEASPLEALRVLALHLHHTGTRVACQCAAGVHCTSCTAMQTVLRIGL